MKNIIKASLIIALLSGCKSFDSKLLNPDGESLSPKLPSLERQIENNYVYIATLNGQFLGPNPQDISVLFDREVAEKITDPYQDKKGFIVLKINTIKHKNVPGWSAYVLVVPVLFNQPIYVSRTELELQVDILNINRRLVGSYRGTSKNGMSSKLFSNNLNGPDLSRTSYMTAIKEALQEAVSKMQPDINRLNNELSK